MTDLPPRLARGAAALLAAGLLAAPAAHARDGVIVSGSAYVDYWGIPDRAVAARSPRSLNIDASLKVGVDVSDDVSFSAKACASCHGIELEHIVVEYQPRLWFNVQAGRILVPFGDYSQRVDPSGHKTASAPLIYDMGRMAYGERSAMNLGVIPQPYTDTGVLAYGAVWLGQRLQLWYGGYAVAGLKGGNDVDWISMRSVYYQDNNREPAGGGRVTLTWSADADDLVGDLSIGASFAGGRYDRDARLSYAMWGADATLRLGPFTARGEYAARRTDLNPDAGGYPYALVDDWFKKEGWYAELEHPLGGHLAAVYRYDVLRRTGAPLPGSAAQLGPDSEIVRYTGGLVITPAQSIYVKLSYERWDATDFADFDSYHLGLGGTF